MSTYKVGDLYHPDVTLWPEAVQYTYRGGGHELLMCFNTISERESNAIRRRPCEFGALVSGPVLFFLYRFETIPWSDVPYNWHVLAQARPAEAVVPAQLEENERALLQINLVEATNGRLAGIRVVSLSINLSRLMHSALAEQAAAPFDQGVYERHYEQVYKTETSESLARRAERYIVG